MIFTRDVEITLELLSFLVENPFMNAKDFCQDRDMPYHYTKNVLAKLTRGGILYRFHRKGISCLEINRERVEKLSVLDLYSILGKKFKVKPNMGDTTRNFITTMKHTYNSLKLKDLVRTHAEEKSSTK